MPCALRSIIIDDRMKGKHQSTEQGPEGPSPHLSSKPGVPVEPTVLRASLTAPKGALRLKENLCNNAKVED